MYLARFYSKSGFSSKLYRTLTRPRMLIIKDPLVKLMGADRFDLLTESRTYRFLVEAFTMNFFSLAITTPNELLIAGMDFDEYVKTRLVSGAVNTLTGRPYGVWRDWLIERLRIDKDSGFHWKYFGDTLAFTCFQLPLYWFSMAVSGVELIEMITASVPLILVAGLTGRPYGCWLDRFRLECGLTAKIS